MKLKKIITVTSSKGGVGKTIFLLNIAGILSKQNKKVLVIDCDLLGGGVAVDLNITPNKNIFNISDDILGNHYTDYKNYIESYQPNLDIIASCKDPRNALKIEFDTIISFIENVKDNYDVILIDTSHGLTKENIMLIDKSDVVLYLMTNDIMDIKNTRAYFEILNSFKINNIKVVLNNARDINLNYFSNYEIKKAINNNIDYTIDKSLFIKNITSFLLEGEIFTLNKSLTFKDKKDLYKLERLCDDLVKDV